MKTYRNYRGVKIYRNKAMVCGSDFDVRDNGTLRARKPQYEISYSYCDGYHCDSLNEVRADIDEMFSTGLKLDIPIADMVEELNNCEPR